MPKTKRIISVLSLIAITVFVIGCGASNNEDEYVVKSNSVKKKKQTEYSSLTGIQKKSLIEQSNLETLTNIVSEYANTTVDRDAMMTKIIELINTPYLWGGKSIFGIERHNESDDSNHESHNDLPSLN